jgi:hypothetical protein
VAGHEFRQHAHAHGKLAPVHNHILDVVDLGHKMAKSTPSERTSHVHKLNAALKCLGAHLTKHHAGREPRTFRDAVQHVRHLHLSHLKVVCKKR